MGRDDSWHECDLGAEMRRGLCSYAELVHRLTHAPATTNELAARGGSAYHARIVPRALMDLGVLCVVGWQRSKKGVAQRVYGTVSNGTCQALPTVTGRPSKHVGAKPRIKTMRSEVIAFAAIWDLLQGPITHAEINQETGVARGTINRLTKVMIDLGMIGIAGWTRNRDAGTWIPQYQRGVTRNKPKPARIPVSVSIRKYTAKRAQRRIFAALGQIERLAA